MGSFPNYLIYDIETSGLYPEKGAEIIQLCAIAVDNRTLEPHSSGSIQLLLKPTNPIEDEALGVIGTDLWERAIDEGLDAKVGLTRFVEWAKTLNDRKDYFSRCIRVGHNILKFDNPFLEYWLRHYKVCKVNNKNDLEMPWQFPSMDTEQIMRFVFEPDVDMVRYNLDACAERLSTKAKRATDLHDAFEDVSITAEIFTRAVTMQRRMFKKMRVISE